MLAFLGLTPFLPGYGEEQTKEKGIPPAGIPGPSGPAGPMGNPGPIENDPVALGVLINEVYLDQSEIELHNRSAAPLM